MLTRIQKYLFASDINMYTEICLGDVPLLQRINIQTKHYNYDFCGTENDYVFHHKSGEIVYN